MSEALILSWCIWPGEYHYTGTDSPNPYSPEAAAEVKEVWIRRLHDATEEQLAAAYEQWMGYAPFPDGNDGYLSFVGCHDDWRGAILDYLSDGINWLTRENSTDRTLIYIGKGRYLLAAGGSSWGDDPSPGFSYLCALNEAGVTEPVRDEGN